MAIERITADINGQSPEDLARIFRETTPKEGYVRFHLSDVLNDRQAEQLAEAMAAYHQSDQFGLMCSKVHCTDYGWSKLFAAMSSNCRFTNLWLRECNIQEAAAQHLARHFRMASHVQHLRVFENRLSASALLQLAEAALHRDSLYRFYVVESVPVEVTQEVVEKLAEVKRKFPQVQGFGDPPLGLALNVRVASASIENSIIDTQVQNLQRQLLENAQSDQKAAEQTFKDLRSLSEREESRLFSLLSDIMAKYETMGGMEFMSLLPANFNDYLGDLTQQIPGGVPGGEGDSVRWQLAKAQYQVAGLRDLVESLERSMGPLKFAAQDSMYVQTMVNSFFDVHGLTEAAIELPAFELSSEKPNLPWHGDYEFAKFENCHPAYSQVGRGDFHIYRSESKFWRLRKVLGSTMANRQLPDDSKPRHSPFTAGVEWKHPCHPQSEVFNFSLKRKKYYLRDAVSKFLKQITVDSDFTAQLVLKDRLVKAHEGPPKNLARALEKGPKYLLDLNRFTMEADSPVILIVGFLLFQELVEGRGGRLTRLSNYHMQTACGDLRDIGGILSSNMDRPPCLHANFMMEGWSYEAMFILSDFLRLKHRMHKFYDITRANAFASALAPVFSPYDMATDGADSVSAELVPCTSKAHLVELTSRSNLETELTSLRHALENAQKELMLVRQDLAKSNKEATKVEEEPRVSNSAIGATHHCNSENVRQREPLGEQLLSIMMKQNMNPRDNNEDIRRALKIVCPNVSERELEAMLVFLSETWASEGNR